MVYDVNGEDLDLKENLQKYLIPILKQKFGLGYGPYSAALTYPSKCPLWPVPNGCGIMPACIAFQLRIGQTLHWPKTGEIDSALNAVLYLNDDADIMELGY